MRSSMRALSSDRTLPSALQVSPIAESILQMGRSCQVVFQRVD